MACLGSHEETITNTRERAMSYRFILSLKICLIAPVLLSCQSSKAIPKDDIDNPLNAHELVAQLTVPNQQRSHDADLALLAKGPEALDGALTLLKLGLKHHSLRVREGSLRGLVAIHGVQSKAVFVLRDALNNSTAQLEQKALIDALAQLGPGAAPALPVLVRFLDPSHNSIIRESVLTALLRMKQSAAPALPQLIELLGEAKLRHSVLLILGQLGPKAQAARSILLELFDDGHLCAALPLKEIEVPASRLLPSLLAVWNSGKRQGSILQILESLGPYGSAAIPVIVEAACSGDLGLRYRAMATLKYMGPDVFEHLPRILKSLAVCDKYTLFSFHQLMKSLGVKVVPILIAALDNPNKTIQKAAAESLGQFGPYSYKAIPPLIALEALETKRSKEINGPNANVFERSLKRIAGIHFFPIDAWNYEREAKRARRLSYARRQIRLGNSQRDIIPALQRLLQSKNPRTRLGAVMALGSFRRHCLEALPNLIIALNDSEEAVVLGATLAVFQLGDLGAEAVTALVNNLNCSSSVIENCALEALGNLGPMALKAVPNILEKARASDRWMQQNCKAALYKIAPKRFPAEAKKKRVVRIGPAEIILSNH